MRITTSEDCNKIIDLRSGLEIWMPDYWIKKFKEGTLDRSYYRDYVLKIQKLSRKQRKTLKNKI